ncbi:unnamed protein product [Vitrella brassicaformis CCMP3155]|uniref:Uncharacterized protein n=1 Tax=Vitrella brassicaformis (strain CCMP3155) TaxID=1169540 RepID=A0A0G4EMU4_VITBC|nr:unnamed protein product [Vitrella brassicaformis CCMP3155]|mmetsp:Transcript_31809/g.78901  ORF Transcript_31809/g.78901 Transcript_31809/m.78901 type:complete len:216 (-) Transcript_31809:253-900(-)|eukprot:CEL98337.1 unnamed protein product [Vitrella brassicaformis CCMP3155]
MRCLVDDKTNGTSERYNGKFTQFEAQGKTRSTHITKHFMTKWAAPNNHDIPLQFQDTPGIAVPHEITDIIKAVEGRLPEDGSNVVKPNAPLVVLSCEVDTASEECNNIKAIIRHGMDVQKGGVYVVCTKADKLPFVTRQGLTTRKQRLEFFQSPKFEREIDIRRAKVAEDLGVDMSHVYCVVNYGEDGYLNPVMSLRLVHVLKSIVTDCYLRFEQ